MSKISIMAYAITAAATGACESVQTLLMCGMKLKKRKGDSSVLPQDGTKAVPYNRILKNTSIQEKKRPRKKVLALRTVLEKLEQAADNCHVLDYRTLEM